MRVILTRLDVAELAMERRQLRPQVDHAEVDRASAGDAHMRFGGVYEPARVARRNGCPL
ncbi:MAG TPA: hypothetical protein VFV98_18845 [Vicinamibacterales bacterium]|nr:hypothetical protein [Vicinamibacterales bacterium]